MPNQPRVFISYARGDGEAFATDLRSRLETTEPEITLWQDRTRMDGGKDWWRQITDALDTVHFMVLVMTPAALVSSVVRAEWQYARQRGVCIYPVEAHPQLDFSAMPHWMRNSHFYHLDDEWETFVNHLKSPCHAARVPFMAPELSSDFVPRPRELAPLLDALLDSERLNPTPGSAAFHGPGGFGKTKLAAAVCHDEAIITAYDAGVIWVTLGEQPNLFNELRKLYAALTGERPTFVDEEEAADALAAQLADGSYLLVIDDVWRKEHLRPFLRGGARCARLVTTRHFDIAAMLESRVGVDEMSSYEAVAMLTAGLSPPPADRQPFRRLAGRLGEWPLLLELARDVLRQRMARGVSLAEALAYLQRVYERKGVTAFDRGDERARNDAVARSLQVSLDELKATEQTLYRHLAIFPDDVEVPLATVASLWGLDDFDCEELADRLAGLSLLYCDLPRRSIRLHDVIRSYLTGQLADPAALHGRLLDGWGDLHTLADAYVWRWVGFHLVAAGRGGDLRALLCDFAWLQTRLAATDANTLVADCERLPVDAAIRRLGVALRQATHILAQYPEQLAGQLWGRLASNEDRAIRTLLAQAREQAPRPYLRPLTESLCESSALIRTLQVTSGPVLAVAVTPDGRRALSSSWDGTFKVWDIDSGAELRSLLGHTSWVLAVAVTPDGRLAISASDDKTLKAWDIDSGAELRTFHGHADRVTAVAVTPDGRRAISASDDTNLKVWEIDPGAELRSLHGHTGSVEAVAVAPDGGIAFSASRDSTLKVWDLHAGRCLATINAGDVGYTCALAPAGDQSVAGGASGQVHFLRLEE